jgi:hypothetical protein
MVLSGEPGRVGERMLLPATTLLVITVLLFAYVFAVRPWHTAWGATHLDRVAKLPGDQLSPRAYHTITHAVNIQTPAEAIWPWIVQIGQERSGFYSYRFLENLVGCQMPKVHAIVPEWQSRAAGDTVWFATPKRYSGRARMVATIVEPGRSLTLASPEDWKRFQSGDEGVDTTWTFALVPKPGGTTRLIARLRSVAYPSFFTRVVNYIFWEPAHFLMERKMLLTIKSLAEKAAHQA